MSAEWRRLVVAAAVGLALALLRTYGISRTFWLSGDQVLYWRMALGPWHNLPLGGGPTSVGGTTIGPVFCWTMWAIGHVVGPWTDNLPHAGGIGLAVFASVADALLFLAIWKRIGSLALALAAVIFLATAPFDMALSATIWNPPFAVAIVEISIACILFGGANSRIGWDAGAAAAAVLAIQAHSSAIFFAAPVIASFVGRHATARRWREAVRCASVLAVVAVLLEAPFLLDLTLHARKTTRPTRVVESVVYTVNHPEALRPVQAFRGLVNACEFILLRPWSIRWGGTLLVIALAMAAVGARRDIPLAGATVAPVLCAVAGFSFWQHSLDSYWFMTIAPSVVLALVLAATLWRRAIPAIAIVLLMLVLIAVPSRVAESHTMFRLPTYGALVRGSTEVRRRTSEIRSISTRFELPSELDPAFLYTIIGGRVAPDAAFGAVIEGDGHVIFFQPPTRTSGMNGR